MATGFFTDTTVCIGCKACEVACKQWNQLPDDGFSFSGLSYDNTVELSASSWRHVAFVEQTDRWLMMSDVCKHCARAGCLEACPTGAIVRTEFDSVYVQPDVCNGCGYCVVSCPFGVIDRLESDGRAWKCTLCYDRIGDGLEPACAKACPTKSIQFGDLEELHQRARERVDVLAAARSRSSSRSPNWIDLVGQASRHPALAQCLQTSEENSHEKAPASWFCSGTGRSMKATCRHVEAPRWTVLSYDMAVKKNPSSGN